MISPNTQKQAALQKAINESKAKNPVWFNPNSATLQNNQARVKQSNAQYLAKVQPKTQQPKTFPILYPQVQQSPKIQSTRKKPYQPTFEVGRTTKVKGATITKSTVYKNVGARGTKPPVKYQMSSYVPDRIYTNLQGQKPLKIQQSPQIMKQSKPSTDPNIQFNPIGEFAKGATSTLKDYAGIFDPKHKSKSNINKSMDYALQGDYSNAGKTISKNPYRLAGELAVEIGTSIVPVGGVAKAVKAGSTAVKASKAIKAENKVFEIFGKTAKESNKVKSNKEIYNSPFFNKHYEQVSTNTKSPIKSKTYDEYGEVKYSYSKAKYQPQFGESRTEGLDFMGKLNFMTNKVKGIPAKVKRGSDYSVASDVRIVEDPKSFGWVKINEPNRIYINKLWTEATPKKVANVINHETFHNTLRKNISDSASGQFDNLIYQSPKTVRQVKKTIGSKNTFDDIFDVSYWK